MSAGASPARPPDSSSPTSPAVRPPTPSSPPAPARPTTETRTRAVCGRESDESRTRWQGGVTRFGKIFTSSAEPVGIRNGSVGGILMLTQFVQLYRDDVVISQPRAVNIRIPQSNRNPYQLLTVQTAAHPSDSANALKSNGKLFTNPEKGVNAIKKALLNGGMNP